jgi:hypothetical protein
VPGISPVVFSAIAVAGPAALVGKVAGDGQTAAPGTAVAVPPTVSVTDRLGNPITNATVQFSVVEGGGSSWTAVAEHGSWGWLKVPTR